MWSGPGVSQTSPGTFIFDPTQLQFPATYPVIYNMGSCGGQATLNITVNKAIDVAINTQDDFGCGAEVTTTITNSIAGTTYNVCITGGLYSQPFCFNVTGQSGSSVFSLPIDRAGSYTVTVTAPAHCTANVQFNVGGVQTLGQYGQVTTFDALGGNINFSGNYRVAGPIKLTNGTFNILQGSALNFSQDGGIDAFPGEGYNASNVLLVSSATLNITGAVLKAASCFRGRWGGIVVTDGSTINTYAGTVANPSGVLSFINSEINNALRAICSIQKTDVNNQTPAVNVYYPNNNIFNLNRTNFNNNEYGFMDVLKAQAALPGEGINNCLFSECSTGVYIDNTLLTGHVDASFRYNIFNNNAIGMYARTWKITIEANQFQNNTTGAIILDSSPNHPAIRYITSNAIQVPAGAYGIAGSGFAEISGNSIHGNSAASTIGVKVLGIAVDIKDGNIFSDLETGIETINPSQNNTIEGNTFQNNITGILFTPSAYSNTEGMVRCNTFSAPNVTGTSRAIASASGSTLTTLGSQSLPNGNWFSSITYPIENNAANLVTYYRHPTSSQESITGIAGTGGGSVQNGTTTLTPAQFCSGQQAGITARQAGTSQAAILNMQDSLRLNLGSFADLKYFQREIWRWYSSRSLLTDLEQYVHTLQGQNQEAYNTLGFNLMDIYREQGQEAPAQNLKTALAYYNPADMEVQYRAMYFDLGGKWQSSLPGLMHLNVSDSTMLAAIANSGTMFADKACTTLRMLYPGMVNCQAPVASRQAAKVAGKFNGTGAAAKAKANFSGYVLGESYPNPTTAEATIPYVLPKGCKTAVIVLHDLVTGKKVVTYKLDTTEPSIIVDLRNIANGLYSYTLMADEKPVATKKLAVTK